MFHGVLYGSAEKIAAAQESALAVQRHLMTLPWQLGLRCLQDALALSGAAVQVGSSRTPAEAVARTGRLTKAAGTATRRAAHLSTAAARLAAAGHKVSVAGFDVTQAQAARDGVDAIEKNSGAIDILINNAGMTFRAPSTLSVVFDS